MNGEKLGLFTLQKKNKLPQTAYQPDLYTFN